MGGPQENKTHSLASLLSAVTPDLSLAFPNNTLKLQRQDEKPAGPLTKAWPNLPSPHGKTLGTLPEAAGTEWETLSFLLKPGNSHATCQEVEDKRDDTRL